VVGSLSGILGPPNTDVVANLKVIGDGLSGHKADWVSKGFIQYMILVIDLIVVAEIFTLALIKKIRHTPGGLSRGLESAVEGAEYDCYNRGLGVSIFLRACSQQR